MGTTEKFNLEAMVDDMGLSGAARVATKKYMESLIAEALQYNEREIRNIAWGYYKGYQDALKSK